MKSDCLIYVGCPCLLLVLCTGHSLLLPTLFYYSASGRLNILSFLVKCYVTVVFR